MVITWVGQVYSSLEDENKKKIKKNYRHDMGRLGQVRLRKKN